MLERLSEIEKRHIEMETALADPEVMVNHKEYKKLTIEFKHSNKIMTALGEYRALLENIKEDRGVIADGSDRELTELAEMELSELEPQQGELEQQIKMLLIPRDENDMRNAVLEIRAGTGGDESGLFAADLYRMYTRYAERNRWKIEVLSSNPTGIGGFKEIICLLSGNEVYGVLKFESGIHRVQRVPATESGGRIHTSAATVAIMPEAEAVDADVRTSDLKVDVYRASGPGGQSVNTTDSAVRITHIPTGLVVTCQDEKSQHKNKEQALKVLATRLYELKLNEINSARAKKRKLQVGTGDRSEKIRTYNFPQNRLTDHRINYTSYDLEQVMDGSLDKLMEALALDYQAILLEGGE